MSTHQDFMDERMLHAFLDGELDSSHEQVLFDKLSSSSALRSEMQQHLAIRKAIQHDNEAFIPPVAATSAVFGALGFTLPPSATAEAAAGGSNLAAGGLATGSSAARRLLFSGGSAVLAFIAALILTLQFPQDQAKTPAVTERLISVPPATVELRETPALGDLQVASSAPVRHVSHIVSVAPAADPVLHRSAADPSPRPVQQIAFLEGEDIDPGRVRSGEVRFFDLVPAPDGITLVARNVSLRSDPAPAIVSQTDPWFRNMNLGVMYALSDHHSIGIEGGQESFPQTFSGYEDGVHVRYEQNPLAYWATAVYQFNGDALLPHVHPFAQAQFGGAFQLGPLARATVGVKFRPFERIAIVAGVEGSTLLYRFQGSWFNTDKIGLTYGVAYEF